MIADVANKTNKTGNLMCRISCMQPGPFVV